jgi:hypothetical protein
VKNVLEKRVVFIKLRSLLNVVVRSRVHVFDFVELLFVAGLDDFVNENFLLVVPVVDHQ